MRPPGLTATLPAIGVSTSPATDLKQIIAGVCAELGSASEADLKHLARVICVDCGIAMGVNKINHLVVRFKRTMPTGSAWTFFLFLTNELKLSEDRRRALLLQPDIYRRIAYADPTGETAARNVDRHRPSP